MEDAAFSDAFCRFVQANLPSVEAAEVLLAAFRNPDVALVDCPAKLREALQAAGLLDAELRYRPASEGLHGFVQTLAKAYEERPVTLIRLIYALRDRKIGSFADAFKLRKD
jgi:hypothetical protein